MRCNANARQTSQTGRGPSHLFIFSIDSRGWPIGWVVWGAPSRSNNTGTAKPFPPLTPVQMARSGPRAPV